MAKEQAIYQIWWDRADGLESAFKNVEPGWRFHQIDLAPLANNGWSIVDMKAPTTTNMTIYVLVERESRKSKEFDDDPPDGSKR